MSDNFAEPVPKNTLLSSYVEAVVLFEAVLEREFNLKKKENFYDHFLKLIIFMTIWLIALHAQTSAYDF